MIGKIVNNYKIESVIGEGGMGTVYLAQHQTLGRKAAIKVLLPEFARNEQIRERFINEAKTLSKLNHQNIVALYDFSDTGGNLMLVMEYVEGTPLDTVIEKITGAIPEQRCIQVFRQILEGFSYAHKKGIIHRDIKPSNLILQFDDTPKILDFGIAKIVEGDLRLTKTGTRMGSVLYMSPEQVMARDVDQRSDIYSLGVTLFEMLTGRLPYNTTTESEFDIQTKIVREPLPSVRSVNPNISEKLENLIFRATDKDIKYRFQSCEEFESALTETGYEYSPAKTIIQETPRNNTAFNISTHNPELKSNTIGSSGIRKTKIPLVYILIGSGALCILILLFVFIFSQNDSAIQKNTISNKNQNIELKENEIREFVNSWLNNQNNKNIDMYLSMYAPDFQGVKRTKSGKITYMNLNEWSDDRRKMYATAIDLNITATDISINKFNTSSGTSTVEFNQRYSSAKYSDEGRKILNLRKNPEGKIGIIYEEMIYSTESGK